MREFLSTHQVPFEERSIADPGVASELIALGYRSAPVTLVGDLAISGLDRSALTAAVAPLVPEGVEIDPPTVETIDPWPSVPAGEVLLVVACFEARALAVVDLRTTSLPARPSFAVVVPGKPIQLTTSARGDVVAALIDRESIAWYPGQHVPAIPATGQEGVLVPVGRQPISVAFDEDARRLFVARLETHELLVLDLLRTPKPRAEQRKTVPLSGIPTMLIFDRDFLYARLQGGGVDVIDARLSDHAPRVVATIASGPGRGLAVGRTASRLYVPEFDGQEGRLAVFDLSHPPRPLQVASGATTAAKPFEVAIDDAAGVVYVSCIDDGVIEMRDATDGRCIRRSRWPAKIRTSGPARDLLVDDRGRLLASLPGRDLVMIVGPVPASGEDPVSEISVPGSPRGLAILAPGPRSKFPFDSER